MSFLTNNKYVKKYFISLKCHTENKSQESKSLLFSQWKKPPKRQQIVLIRNNAFLWYRWKWVIFYAFSKEAAFFFFSTKTKNGEMYLLWHVLTCDSEGLSVWLTKWPQTLESSEEKDGLLLWCITEILALFNQVKSRPCICHHLQKHISLSALWSAGRNAPRVRFHTENTGRGLQSDLQAAEVISISVEQEDYKDFDFDEFMISSGYSCKWDSAFQNQLDSKANDSPKIKTNIMKFEIKWWYSMTATWRFGWSYV